MMHEQLTINEHIPVITRFYDYERFTFPWHFHREYEIIYFAEGEGDRFVADNVETIRSGDIILIGSSVPHYMRSAEKYYAGDASLRIKGVNIQFAHNYMSYAISNYTDMNPIRTLLKTADRGIYFPPPENAALIESICELPGFKGVERMVRLLLLLDRMAHFRQQRILATSHFSLHVLPPYADSRMEKVLAYINRNYVKNIKLSDISAIASMNMSAFCRYFKEKSGKSPVDYVQELRVGYACKLLTSSQLDILQICIECGFNTSSHFNKVFKHYTNLTPTDYRKQFLTV
jgi:AraC-like DNA-binding protein